MRFRIIICVILAMSMGFFSSAHAAEKLRVAASFSIIGDMVHEVAGDKVELTVLVGANGDTHEYEPTPHDAKILASSDVIFVNGLGLEGWLERLIRASNFQGKIVTLGDSIVPLSLGGATDPHAWQDVRNGKRYVSSIRDALIKFDASNADFYRSRAQAYIQQLDELDRWVKVTISNVPVEKRKVISTHDAFGYFSKAYGVEFLSALGTSTESQASAADIAALINQIRSEHVRAVFFENMTDSRIIKQLEADANAVVGGTLYSDALSKPEDVAGNYISMFRHNVSLLAESMIKNP